MDASRVGGKDILLIALCGRNKEGQECSCWAPPQARHGTRTEKVTAEPEQEDTKAPDPQNPLHFSLSDVFTTKSEEHMAGDSR